MFFWIEQNHVSSTRILSSIRQRSPAKNTHRNSMCERWFVCLRRSSTMYGFHLHQCRCHLCRGGGRNSLCEPRWSKGETGMFSTWIADGTSSGYIYIGLGEVVLYSLNGNFNLPCMKFRCVIADCTFVFVGRCCKGEGSIYTVCATTSVCSSCNLWQAHVNNTTCQVISYEIFSLQPYLAGANRDEQMSGRWPFSILNDEQTQHIQ